MSDVPNTVGEVVVVGSRPIGGDAFVYWGFDGSRLASGGWQTGGGGGGTNGPPHWFNEQIVWDEAADELATHLSAAIENDPMYNQVEIGFVMYREADGQVKSLGPFYGTAADPHSINFQFAGVQPGDIIGLIHSHPAALNDANWAMTPWPSDNGPGQPSDWNAAEQLRNAALSPADFEFYFRHYIIGPDNLTREFGYYNRSHTAEEIF
ncbi:MULTISPECIES: hypothetical protein [unclassified Phenylobacterium]|jgi:hypothetical protein|uniref:hypothetical protein n=1 Tax=unclassified Phenylobacterium TaxID=2640670 RepID=UPI0012E76618|nr:MULTISPECIES: hypothetical protein [unclassified Phenylobacterium]